ncbi:hypothetical protein GJAV_G00032560 [Gymnothorax javanicus]|nr:hypothetical protein GJAV_G00032560 [Gymnothorax javanicus]
MKYLALALLLCSLVDLLHGACYQMAGPKLGETVCEDLVDHTRHAIGSSWRNSACQDCDCSGCCDAFNRPTSIPEDCMMEFDKGLCEYKSRSPSS